MQFGRLFARSFVLFLLCVSTLFVSAQQVVSGIVRNEKQLPLAGASVTIKGKKTGGATTDADGHFSITLPAGTLTLQFSYVGYQPREWKVQAHETAMITLLPQPGSLDSVVMVGYTSQRRRDVTGAISSVKGDLIKNIPSQNVAELIQGRMAGVEVVKESAEPGSKGAQITIRGVSSLSQPDPLYVIDGVIQKNNPGVNINPQDIANIDVLKDASAAAIYGASAAGGVIIITTKKGNAGEKPTVNFNARYGLTKPLVFDLLNKEDFLRYKSLTDPSGYYSRLAPDQVAQLADYNWVDGLYGTGNEQNYNLSFAGKTQAVDFFISGNYNKQKGIFLDNTSDFGSVRINTDVKVSDKIKVGEQISAWKRTTSPVKTQIVVDPFRTVPTAGPYTNDPTYPWSDFPGGYQGVNVMAQIKTTSFDFPENNFQGNAYVELKLPPKYLTFRATFGYTYSTWENNIFYDTYNTSASQNLITQLYRANGKYEQFMNAYVLSYDKSFGKHTLNVLGGFESYHNKTSSLTTSANAVAGTSYGYILTSGSARNLAGGYDPNGLVRSVFGRVNYEFDKKVMATATVRSDANYTTFGPTHHNGVFPSVSLGWKLHEEDFFHNALPFFGQFKLRAGYGGFGNSAIGNYNYVTRFAVAGAQSFASNGTPLLGYTQEQIANQDVKWESLYETNIGVDGEAFQGKLYFSFDWYDKRTKDMLYWVPVPLSVGIPPRYEQVDNVYIEYPPSILTNVGEVKNSGVDMMVGFKNSFHQVNYNFSFTGSFNKNKVVNLDGTSDAAIKNYGANANYPATDNSLWVNQPLTYTATGLPFGQFYGYKVLGMFKTNEEAEAKHSLQPKAQAGDLEFWDRNGDGVINDDDKTVIGNPYPKFTFGLAGQLSWKKFDLSFLFNGVVGVDIYNGVAPYTMSLYDGGNVTDKIFNASFLGDNGLTSQPRIGGMDGRDFVRDPNGNYSKANSYFIENGSYLKLKNLQIGYTLPDNWMRRVKLKNCRFYVMGNNLFAITKYSGMDPEIGGGVIARGIDRVNRYPNARLFAAGLDISF